MDGHGLGRRVSRPEAGRGLLVVGDVVTDVVARHGSALAHGTDTKARIRTLPGGAGANVACWAVRSGCPDVRLLARAGAESADWHREALETAGVRAFLAVDDEVPTATVVALVDAAAERTFLTDGGAVLRLAVEDFAPTMLDGVGRLHLSGYLLFAAVSRAAALLALRTAVERGVPVSVDPASAGFLGELGPKRFLEFAEGAQLLLPNADEARLLTGLPEPGAAAAELSRRFPRVVVTLGARGAVVAAGGEVVGRVPAPPVPEPVDSTGAGDAFTGGFLAALLAGADDVTAAAEGCRAGASAVAAVGGRPPVR
ncbi:carbohydrate kinase family protein [Streptomyces globisporus]|uniref:carbohydrate kinase family protein n=1 Tax=Streptomyces globisporus TaxID=1908 RepID=UPI0038078BE7